MSAVAAASCICLVAGSVATLISQYVWGRVDMHYRSRRYAEAYRKRAEDEHAEYMEERLAWECFMEGDAT